MGQLDRFVLTGGEVGDVTQAKTLLLGIDTHAVVADKGYDSDALVQFIREGEAKAVIPPRCNRLQKRRVDRRRYRARNLIERCFCRLKHFRRIATRYEKLAQHYASFLALSAAVVWLGAHL